MTDESKTRFQMELERERAEEAAERAAEQTAAAGKPMAAPEERPMDERRDYADGGVLFSEQDKRGETGRDYAGSLDASCSHCGKRLSWWLSGYFRTSRAGRRFLSLKVKTRSPEVPNGAARPAQDDSAAF